MVDWLLTLNPMHIGVILMVLYLVQNIIFDMAMQAMLYEERLIKFALLSFVAAVIFFFL